MRTVDKWHLLKCINTQKIMFEFCNNYGFTKNDYILKKIQSLECLNHNAG